MPKTTLKKWESTDNYLYILDSKNRFQIVWEYIRRDPKYINTWKDSNREDDDSFFSKWGILSSSSNLDPTINKPPTFITSLFPSAHATKRVKGHLTKPKNASLVYPIGEESIFLEFNLDIDIDRQIKKARKVIYKYLKNQNINYTSFTKDIDNKNVTKKDKNNTNKPLRIKRINLIKHITYLRILDAQYTNDRPEIIASTIYTTDGLRKTRNSIKLPLENNEKEKSNARNKLKNIDERQIKSFLGRYRKARVVANSFFNKNKETLIKGHFKIYK